MKAATPAATIQRPTWSRLVGLATCMPSRMTETAPSTDSTFSLQNGGQFHFRPVPAVALPCSQASGGYRTHIRDARGGTPRNVADAARLLFFVRLGLRAPAQVASTAGRQGAPGASVRAVPRRDHRRLRGRAGRRVRPCAGRGPARADRAVPRRRAREHAAGGRAPAGRAGARSRQRGRLRWLQSNALRRGTTLSTMTADEPFNANRLSTTTAQTGARAARRRGRAGG